MTLRELIEGLPNAGSTDIPETRISGLAYSSQSVAPGTLFFCVPGFRRDGHEFAPDAVARGAVALVCERRLELDVPQLVVESVRCAMAPIAARFYGDPSAELELIGVTGTNGKTTTAFLVQAIEEAAGRSCGLLGTVRSVIGGQVAPVERTTPEAIDLQAVLRRMVDAGNRACAMEVSSHATELHRTDAIRFSCAIFTNLTQDHLDFHETIDRYFEAKRRLFFPEEDPRPAVSVLNADDARGRALAEELGAVGGVAVTYAIDRPADFCARAVEFDAAGASFVVEGPGGEQIEVATPLLGLFNVSNVLGAVAAARSLGIDAATIRFALARAGQVPGRFEPVDEGQDFTVLVDYAHTPDSLDNVLRAARAITPKSGRVCVVFGCGGDRDRGKRPLMGEIARRLADRVVVTSDNPRSEGPRSIIDQILEGAERAEGARLEVEPDRRAAIQAALRGSRANDTVVIAGKGHELGQEFERGRKLAFDDREVARDELRRLSAPAG